MTIGLISKELKARFLLLLGNTADATASAAQCGVTLRRLTNARQDDPEFDQDWTDTNVRIADSLEAAAFTRAVHGVERKRYNKDGDLISEERIYSDTVLIAMLKAKRAEQYGDRSRVDLSSTDGSMSPAPYGDTEVAARLASFMAIATRRMEAAEGSPEPIEDDGGSLV